MAKWARNNRACTTLWSTLFRMNQIFTAFDDSGELPMNELTFFNEAASDELRKTEAEMLANQLDNIFIIGRGALYEEDIEHSTALSAMISLLTDAERTVEELASVVDDNYLFWGERNILQ